VAGHIWCAGNRAFFKSLAGINIGKTAGADVQRAVPQASAIPHKPVFPHQLFPLIQYHLRVSKRASQGSNAVQHVGD
jgi:hypothetical protein